MEPMTATLETILLPEARFTDASHVLGRAFEDDPLFVFMEPDDERRRRVLPWFLGVGTRYGLMFGEVHTAREQSLGAAVWLPPGRTEVGPDGLAQAGFDDAATVIGEDALGRFGTFMEHAGGLHARDMPGPHWYLMILGVDPPWQGRGVGGRLIQPVLARADTEALPCYLETAKERNLPFYRRHGFEVVVEDVLPGGGPRFWTMRRDARRRF
jgi:GNAT superfamily N-acetyltransferase